MSRGETAVLEKDNTMKRLNKVACLACMILMLVPMNASAGTKGKQGSQFDWNPVIDAIIEVESEGNAKAVDKSGKSCGILQITPILVKDCNEILKKQKSKKRYTLADRYSVAKSKEMFLIIQKYYNPQNDVEKAIRLWNGGVKYSVRATNKYYNKVLAQMK